MTALAEWLADLPGVRTTTCRDCDAKVIWATTTKNNSMLVDVEPKDDGNVVVRMDHGLAYADVLGQPPLMPTILRHSHMETCPFRENWIKPKPRKVNR